MLPSLSAVVCKHVKELSQRYYSDLVKTLKKKQSTRHPVYNCRLQFKKGLASELGNDPQAAIKCVNRFPRCIFVTFCAGTTTAPSRCCKTSQ